ncbi:MAG: hypothetical protein K2W82_11330 [Candidatus Obscuribacterales bacterium]|jgi:hypothetical protein|nr:hypothetical protein [Candidatus Obscuribacterales bacterium]
MQQPKQNVVVNCFNPADRRFHEALQRDENGVLTGNDGVKLESKDVIVLLSCGRTDSQGQDVCLGDMLRIATDGGHIDFVVRNRDYYGNDGARLEGWHLHAYAATRGESQLEEFYEVRPIEQVANMSLVGNIYRQYEQYVPAHTHYCYRLLSAGSGGMKRVLCPFFEHSTFGMVHCGLLNLGAIDNSSGAYEEAVAHLGSAEAAEEKDQLLILWDEVKECSFSLDE